MNKLTAMIVALVWLVGCRASKVTSVAEVGVYAESERCGNTGRNYFCEVEMVVYNQPVTLICRYGGDGYDCSQYGAPKVPIPPELR